MPESLYDIYKTVIHVIGLTTVVYWVRRIIMWVFKNRNGGYFYYNTTVYKKETSKDRDKILRTCHEKLRKQKHVAEN